jgi:hypothetical protein
MGYSSMFPAARESRPGPFPATSIRVAVMNTIHLNGEPVTTAEQPPPEGSEQPPQAAEGDGLDESSEEFAADPASDSDGEGRSSDN